MAEDLLSITDYGAEELPGLVRLIEEIKRSPATSGKPWKTKNGYALRKAFHKDPRLLRSRNTGTRRPRHKHHKEYKPA